MDIDKSLKSTLFEALFSKGYVLDILKNEYYKHKNLERIIKTCINNLKDELEEINNSYIYDYESANKIERFIHSCKYILKRIEQETEQIAPFIDEDVSRYRRLELLKPISIEKLGHLLSNYTYFESDYRLAAINYER